ncbi:MAG: hypothetical protein Q7V19_00935, partial [Bacteroidales bacterium]|nr:hypothetical protein [Bacteroidales bacterium]
FGKAFIPSYQFHKAEIIVSFDADFLGTWLSPVEYTKQYIKNRKLTAGQGRMSSHIHFEGAMSLTGSNADHRVQLKPSQQKLVVANLLNELRGKMGLETASLPASPLDVEKLATELLQHKGKSLIVSGSNDTEEQMLVNAVNHLLESYGNTILTDVHTKIRQADDARMDLLVQEMNEGKVDGLIIYDVNPAYDYPQREKFIEGLKKVSLSVALPVLDDETTSYVKFICPDHHYLEAWNDFEPLTGHYSLAQPAIRPIFKTRAAQESLLRWTGKNTDYRTFMAGVWEQKMFAKDASGISFTDFWNKKVHDGVFETDEKETATYSFVNDTSFAVLSNIKDTSGEEAIDLVLYTNVSVGSGKHANNPWLQELPDPVSKACWDNYVAISPRLAKELSLKNDELLTVNG